MDTNATNTTNTNGQMGNVGNDMKNSEMNGNNKSVGPIIGLIVIIVLIIVGGIYFWSTRSNMPSNIDNVNEMNIEDDNPVSTTEIESQGSSDDLGSIEGDLNSFNEADIDGIGSNI